MSEETLLMLQNFLPIVVMIGIFYFLFYRPQKKEQGKREQMLSSLKKGDRIVTIGGIYGTITGFTDKTVILKIHEKMEITIARSAVSHSQNDTTDKK